MLLDQIFLFVFKALQENERLKSRMTDLVNEKGEMRTWFEKVTSDAVMNSAYPDFASSAPCNIILQSTYSYH